MGFRMAKDGFLMPQVDLQITHMYPHMPNWVSSCLKWASRCSYWDSRYPKLGSKCLMRASRCPMQAMWAS